MELGGTVKTPDILDIFGDYTGRSGHVNGFWPGVRDLCGEIPTGLID